MNHEDFMIATVTASASVPKGVEPAVEAWSMFCEFAARQTEKISDEDKALLVGVGAILYNSTTLQRLLYPELIPDLQLGTVQ